MDQAVEMNLNKNPVFAPNGERRSEVVRRANSLDNERVPGVFERVAAYEHKIIALDDDLALPDKYRAQRKAEERASVKKDLDKLYAGELNRAIVAEDEKIATVMAEAKSAASFAQLIGVDLQFIGSTNDVASLVDFTEELMALGQPARIARALPAIEARLTALTAGSSDQTLRATVKGVTATAAGWRKDHPSVAARLRDIQARRAGIESDLGAAFNRTLQRLGLND